jgi:hypothetical protein
VRKSNRRQLGLLGTGILACLSATVGAQIFTEDFNSYSGNQNNTQGDTGLEVAHSGTVASWTNSGAGTMHAVDLTNLGGESNPSDWAIMFWQDNVITQTVGIAANKSGTSYEVNFDYGTAVYAQTHMSQRTLAGDELLVVVLRGDNSVLASGTFAPGEWVDGTTGNWNLQAGLQGTLPYAGDGTGDVRLRIGPAPGTLNQGRFAGEIDNLSVSEVSAGAISITSFTTTPDTLADTEDPVTFDWTVTGMPLDSLEITPGNIDVLGDTDGAGIGSNLLDPGPDGTTEYTLTAIKGGDTVTRMVTVSLPAPEITSFTASPSPLAPGEDLTLSWQVGLPATTLVITPGDIDVSGDTDGTGAGSIIVNPTESTTYTLTATRGTSTSTANALAIVQTPPNPDALAYESFDGITAPAGNFNGAPNGQVTTTHDLAFGASLSGWTGTGGGVIHAVDTHNTWTGGAVSANLSNWGLMIWQDNVLTQDTGIAGSNDSGVVYSIDFLAAGAVYELAGQLNDGSTDGIRIEVLRASDSAVLHTFDHVPAPPVGVDDLGLLPVNFTFTGDGSGDILFRVGPSTPNMGRFGGTIDDLALSVLAPNAPQVQSFMATPDVLSDVGEAVTFEWKVGGLPVDSLVITPGDIDVLGDTDGAGTGSHLLDPGPDGTTEYTLTATKGGEGATRKVTVTLPAPEIAFFTASPSPLAPGENLTLSWQVGLPAATLTITPGDLEVSGDTDGTGAGSIIVNPTETTTYTLTATLGTSTSTAGAIAIVQTPPNPNAIAYESFEGITGGGFNGGQFESGLDLAFGADLPGWAKAGGGVVHVVDSANLAGDIVSPRNFAVMIWQDNVITQEIAMLASNEAGTEYLVAFEASPAVYQQGQQQTSATDGLLIELLNPTDVVVASYTHLPGAWAGNTILIPDSFTYTGDGSGDLRFRVGPSAPGSGRFGGAIDNLVLSPAASSTLDLRVTENGANLDFEWDSKESFLYNLRTSTDLSADLATWDLVEVDGVFDIVGTPPLNMHSIVRPGDPVRFYRVQEFPPPPLLEENFDDEPGPGLPAGWSTAAGTTAWEVGDPTGGPGPQAAVSALNCAGTGITTNYAASTTYSLVSPPLVVPAGGATLSFRQYIDTDLAGDVGTIRILDADNADALLEEMNPPGNIEDVEAGWSAESFALPGSAAGKNIKIEFRFVSNGSQEWAGFYVDNVRVEAN